MQAFSAAIVQFFGMLITLFSAGEKLASSINNLAIVADESSGDYADEARIQRQMRKAQREHERNKQTLALANDTSAPKLNP
jgi:hypothetical protein